MPKSSRTSKKQIELEELRARLAEAEQTLNAIRGGEVDAIAVDGPNGRQIFTLQGADQPYRILVERMNEGAAWMNVDGTILFCNERFAAMVGRRPEKLMCSPIMALLPQAESEYFHQLLLRGLEGESRGETSFEREDGNVTPALVSLKAIATEQERGVCLVAADLAELKEAQGRLQRINRTLQALSESTEALMRATEEQTMLQQVCESLVRAGDYRMAWVGYADSDKKKTVRPVAQAGFEEGYLKEADISWAEAERGGRPTGEAIRTAHVTICQDIAKDPHLGPWREEAMRRGYRSSMVLPLNDERETFGALSIYASAPGAFDMREQRLLEELATNVAYAIATLRARAGRKKAEQALAEKAKELAKSNEELAQFAYIASHDLQEPLRKIRTFGDRLVAHATDVLDEQGRDYLERMQTAAKRMSELITSLLTLSRVTSHARVLEPVDLNKVLSDVLSDLEVRMQQSGGHVEAGELPHVTADQSQMRQLFQNLIGNALKFHKQDIAPVVRVHAYRNAKAWEIHVEDNGIGFDEQDLLRIFGAFQRLNPISMFEGTGMGLAICKKIVNGHSGEITARSQPGIGSDFIVTLPAAESVKQATASQAQVSA